METYKASLGITAIIITAFYVLTVFVATGAIIFCIYFQAPIKVAIIPCIFFSFLPLGFIYTFLIYKVKCYQITADEFIIKKHLSRFDKIIPLSEIESISIPDKSSFNWMRRNSSGYGGLLGFYGTYDNKTLGSFKMYATNKKNRVLIELKDSKGKIVISPDDTFMADDLQKQLKKAV